MKAKAIIGFAIILLFMALGVYTFSSNQVASVSISKARTASRTVQTQGSVDFTMVDYDVEKKTLVFFLVASDTAHPATHEPDRLKVLYHGEIPGNFQQAKSVTVIGKPGPDGFVAEKMLVKCPSKYQGEDGKTYEKDETRTYSSGA